MFKPRDSVANFQFIIDAFKSDKQKPKTTDKPKSKNNLVLDVSRLQLRNIYVEHHHATKKYQMADTYSMKLLTLKPKGKKYVVTIDGLRYTTDNHLPRKNANRPKRGFFDAGHLDVKADLELMVNHYGKDTVNIEEDIEVSYVEFVRDFAVTANDSGKYSTVVFPFDFNVASVSGLDDILEFSQMIEENGKLKV